MPTSRFRRSQASARRTTSSRRWARSSRERQACFSSGNAGLASNFMDLGHSKLKDGGVLALVIPFAFVRGKSWKGAREALQAHYSDVHVTSIAATTGSTTRAFSADTGMAECLVVATKRERGQVPRRVLQSGGKTIVAPGSRCGSE